LRGVMELIEGAVRIIKVDELSEAIEELKKASLAIENARATVSLFLANLLIVQDDPQRAYWASRIRRMPGIGRAFRCGTVDRSGGEEWARWRARF
jgi:hypothetical protein